MVANTIRWSARGLAVLIILFFAMFILAHLVGDKKSDSDGFTPDETLMFAAVAMMLLGLIGAWKWELIGGLVTVAGYLLFAEVEGKLILPWPFLLCLINGLLFLVSWVFHRKQKPLSPV